MDKISIVTPKKGYLAKFGRYLAFGKNGMDGSIALQSQNAKDNEVIVKQILTEFKDLSAKSIQNWHDALVMANDLYNPRWAPLMDVIDQLEPDAQLGVSKDIRAAVTLGRKFMIYSKKTNEEIPEKTALLKDKEWFFNWQWHVLDTIFYGNTPIQLINPKTMEFSYLPRRNYIPQRNFFVFQTMGDEGYDLADPAFADSVMVIKYKHTFGILNDIIPCLIWKKNAIQAYAEFVEKFGIPPVWATTKKSDKKSLDAIEAGLKQLGQAMSAVLPEGTTIQVDESAHKNDPYNVFIQMINKMDDYIVKRLLGGTMVLDNGSSRSQSEVHERTLNETIGLFDKQLLQSAVNNYLLPMMAKFGYPFTDDDAFRFDETEELELKDFGDLVNNLSANYEFDIDWINKRFGTQIIKAKGSPSNGSDAAGTNSFNEGTTALAAALVPHGIMLPKYVGCNHHNFSPLSIRRGVGGEVVASFTNDLLAELSDILINEIWEGKDTLVTQVLKSIASFKLFQQGLFDSWGERRMQLTYDATDNHCLASMEYNLFEFSRLKEEANVFALNQLLLDKEKNNINSLKDFQTQAQQYLKDPDVNWQQAEYNYTVASGQGASRYNQFMSEKNTVTKWGKIQTMRDNRVRPTHRILEGKIFSFDNPGGCPTWTPFDIGCRCEIIQFLGKPDKESIITNNDILPTIGKQQGDKWTGNRALNEQVFTKNELYMKQHDLTNEEGKMTFKQYQLPSVSEMKNLPALKLDASINEQNAGELFKPISGTDYMGFEDHLKRKLIITKETFNKHTEGKYTTADEQRHQLFPHVADVLKNPDEVYFTKYQQRKDGKVYFQTNYIKYYEGNKSLVVNTELGSTNVQINTWYLNNVPEEKMRSGYLIHRANKKP